MTKKHLQNKSQSYGQLFYKEYLVLFRSENECIEALEVYFWTDGNFSKKIPRTITPKCPYCKRKIIERKKVSVNNKFFRYQCNCESKKKGKRTKFSILDETVFVGTKVPIKKWFIIGAIIDVKKSNKPTDLKELNKIVKIDLRTVHTIVNKLQKYYQNTGKDILWEIRDKYRAYLLNFYPSKFRKIQRKEIVIRVDNFNAVNNNYSTNNYIETPRKQQNLNEYEPEDF